MGLAPGDSPKTWYQVSRSLLKALREKTRTYLAEGLSYSQARGFIETASHNISQAIKGGDVILAVCTSLGPAMVTVRILILKNGEKK